jgi:hypothetical protein
MMRTAVGLTKVKRPREVVMMHPPTVRAIQIW